jgi:hypothetical protein
MDPKKYLELYKQNCWDREVPKTDIDELPEEFFYSNPGEVYLQSLSREQLLTLIAAYIGCPDPPCQTLKALKDAEQLRKQAWEKMEQENHWLRNENLVLKTRVEAIESSTTWRMSEPLRKFVTWIRLYLEKIVREEAR